MITNDEFRQFKSLATKKKVDSMELYLIGANGCRFNMQEVGAKVFGDDNYSYTVSMIHRCYNFSGQNSGKYRNGCKFEQMYGYRVSRKDIEAFVKKYPNGTFNNGVTFEDFLRTRLNNTQKFTQQVFSGQPEQVKQQYNYQKNNYIDDPDVNRQLKGIMVFILSVGTLILLIMFFSGNLFKHWIVSLIVLFFTIEAFVILKDNDRM